MKNFVSTISIFILLLFSGFNSVFAQGYPRPNVNNIVLKDAKITGTISDGTSNQTIPYASIAIYHSTDSTLVTGVLSKDDGSFVLDKLPYGKYYIVVTFVGYKKHKIDEIVLSSAKKTVALGTVKVTTATTSLKEVEVIGSIPPVTYQIDKKVVNIAQNITAAGSTLAEALQNAPSIQTDVEGNITLRGSSTYTVLIDGRPSPITGSEALQQIPASLVQNVELITNPSAKYEAEGSAGIINIIMKKQKMQGSSGIVNITAGTGDKYTGNLNLSYKISKFNFTLGGDFTDYTSAFKSNQNVTDTLSPLSLKKQVISGSGDLRRKGNGIRAEIGYNIDDKNSLTLTGSIGSHAFDRTSSASYHDSYTPSLTNFNYLNNQNPEFKRDFKSINLDYLLKLNESGHQLSASVYFTGGPGGNVSLLKVDTTDINWNKTGRSLSQQSNQNNNQTDFRTKIDYTLPIGEKGKLEAGYQGRNMNNQGSYHLTNLGANNQWIEDLTQRDLIDFKDQIYAGYVTYLNSMPLFDYQLGLRTEHENRYLNQEIQNKVNRVNRTDFFPSIHLTKQLPWDLQLQTSYTRRINRPMPWNINPFVIHLDPQTIQMGNAGLLPEFANSYELNLEKKLNDASFVSAEGYLRQTYGLIQQISLFDPVTQITTNTFGNIDHDRSMGAEFMVNLQPSKWFNLNSSFNVFNYHMFGTLIPSIANSTNTWNIHVNPTFHLGKSTSMQITYIYNAPTIAAQGTRSGFYSSTVAIKQNLLNRKASLTLQMQNLIGQSVYSNTTQSASQYKYNTFRRESQVFLLTFSYRINNYRVAQSERRGQDESNGNREQFMEQ